ncbi:S8 family peptidase [Jiangella mangrovi]|uniref:Subtilisin family serine protease n=1 Tax=Jiangella mangrovi TaxID=1524084 RepID=A0A7W9GXH4_9ACTN|nr:S8 family peptidase [Jiangella mangrovi]MBB5791883.1 subtilisin family serine protease [Jiangella mangrovi]
MRRRPPTAALLAVALPGVLALSPAAATPAASPAPVAPPVLASAPVARTTTADLTLLTGHVIRVGRAPDGQQSATVLSVPEGADGNVLTFTDDSDLHVVPREALPLLHADRLDGRLFNVTDLVADGYTDADRDGIPLLVGGSNTATSATAATAATARATAGVSGVQVFDSAGVTALTVGKDEAAAFWQAAIDGPATLAAGGKIWLDGPVRARLDRSVPLVRAPEAWAQGYDGDGVTVAVLDTGYDPAHPDLAGLVAEARSFDETGSAVDGHGHGTHVAATVAGSGAASDGTRRGVAPGARLLVGKVLDDSGQGQESWLLAGMQWAARSGADIVNMSLGGGPSDGSDPLSQAVNDLTAETGALFVVAAGNSGPSAGTVDTPGAADAALTVGNTTLDDVVNEGSSRGPRLGDHAVKPELAAPGTDIVAARAAGTSLGAPVDEHYTSVTGTSMATPHVAGAAAIVAQRHPDWTPARLKAALVGHAHPLPGGTVFDRGAGRLDVAAALEATVTAEPSTLAFGFLSWPNEGAAPIVRTVTYRNEGSAAATLDLAVDGGAAAVTVEPEALTVPPGGTASAVVTVDPELVGPGDLGGLLLATMGDGDTVRTPWSYGEESEHYTLTLDATGRDGERSAGWAMLWSEAMGFYYYGVSLDGTGPEQVRLPADDYMVIGASTVYEDGYRVVEETLGGDPELSLTADTTLTFDARDGDPLVFDTPRPSTPAQVQLGWTRWYESGASMDGWAHYDNGVPKLAIASSEPVTEGRFEFVAGGRLTAPGTPVERTPYLYDLLLPTQDRLPASGTFTVDSGDLARIDTTFVGVGSEGRASYEVREGFSALATSRVKGVNMVHAAGPRTDWVSANGTAWQSMVTLPHDGGLEVPVMFDNHRTYAPGSRHDTRWWGAPYSAGTDSVFSITDAYRSGDELNVLLRDYQDGEADHWGDSYLNEDGLASVRSRLYADGVLLADEPRGSLTVSGLSPEPATYRLVHSVARTGPTWTSSAYSESDWTFRSAHSPAGEWPPAGIPLLDVNWTVPTDAQNVAPGGSRFTVELHARHVRDLPAAPIEDVRVSVSYDDGATWKRVPLLPRRGDHYTAILVHPAATRTSGWVSLRAEVTDADGATLKQTTIRAYALD